MLLFIVMVIIELESKSDYIKIKRKRGDSGAFCMIG